MRVHLLGTPNVQQTKGFVLDGFAMITLRFCEVLQRLGIDVILYGSEQTDAPVSQFVSVISKQEIDTFLAGQPYQRMNYSADNPMFQVFNSRASAALSGVKRHGDVLATICGIANAGIANAHPELTWLEWSIGYQGVCPQSHRVFQSASWRSYIHGNTATITGREFDAVIPPFYDVTQFSVGEPEDYVLYVGRTDAVKGSVLAERIAKEAGVRLLMAGYGDTSQITYGQWLGDVSDAERNRLLANARAVLMPTRYLEPFGQVAAEAQLCGTPVLGPDFGAFVETIEHGRTGFRCTSVGEYVAAIERARFLDREAIRARAVRLWSLETAVESYRTYFARLARLRADGFDSLDAGALAYGSLDVLAGADCSAENPARHDDRHVGAVALAAEAVA